MSETQSQLFPGTAVEVLPRFDARWSPGFTVERVQDDGYVLRRRSDDQILPIAIPASHVREAS